MSKATQKRIKSLLFFIINLVLSIITMSLVLTLIGTSSYDDINKTSYSLVLVIVSVIIYQVFLFIRYPNAKDRTRLIIITPFYVVATIFAFKAKDNYKFFYFSAFVIVVALALSQILRVFIHNKEKSKAEVFTNLLVGLTLSIFSVAILLEMNKDNSHRIAVVPGLLFLVIAMKNIIMPSLKFTKVKIFLDILIKTHTFDVLICLLAMIITFSFLFPMFEDDITNFWDAMWYCFAVVTTIGFGDFAATSAIGRILTVLLGIYGIVVVAILTSVIVSYYGSISKKEKDEEKYIE